MEKNKNEKKTIVWTRPSGTKLETNTAEATVKHCEKLGFKREGEAPKKAAGSGAAGSNK